MLFCEYFSTRTVGCMPSARFPNRICQYFFSRHPSGWSRDAFGTLLVCLSIKKCFFLFLVTSSQIGLISLIIRCVVVWRTFWLRHTEAVSPIRMYRRHCKWKMWRTCDEVKKFVTLHNVVYKQVTPICDEFAPFFQLNTELSQPFHAGYILNGNVSPHGIISSCTVGRGCPLLVGTYIK